MPLVWNSGDVEVLEWIEQEHSAVQEGGSEYIMAIGGVGGKGGDLKGVYGLRATSQDGPVIQIPG